MRTWAGSEHLPELHRFQRAPYLLMCFQLCSLFFSLIVTATRTPPMDWNGLVCAEVPIPTWAEVLSERNSPWSDSRSVLLSTHRRIYGIIEENRWEGCKYFNNFGSGFTKTRSMCKCGILDLLSWFYHHVGAPVMNPNAGLISNNLKIPRLILSSPKILNRIGSHCGEEKSKKKSRTSL